MANDSRESMVRSAALLIASRGLTATSFSEVLGASGAPRGSIYHHFPAGKRQLAEDAVGWAVDGVLARQRALDAGTPGEVLDAFVTGWRRLAVATSGAVGCALAGVTVDTAPDDPLLAAVRGAFRSWVDLLAEQFAATGVAADAAGPLATTLVAGMEGALLLCRAEGGPGPLDTVAGQLRRLLPPAGPPVSPPVSPPA